DDRVVANLVRDQPEHGEADEHHQQRDAAVLREAPGSSSGHQYLSISVLSMIRAWVVYLTSLPVSSMAPRVIFTRVGRIVFFSGRRVSHSSSHCLRSLFQYWNSIFFAPSKSTSSLPPRS